MIKLTLTDSQANLVWLALKQAEENALDNQAIKTVDQLVMIRLDLEYNVDQHKSQKVWKGLGF